MDECEYQGNIYLLRSVLSLLDTTLKQITYHAAPEEEKSKNKGSRKALASYEITYERA
jgi:hypothetical protein